MTVDRIDDDGDSVLVTEVDELLKVGRFAKTLGHAEITDGVVSPVDRAQNVRNRHDFDAIDTKICQVRKLPDGAIEVVAKLADHQLINNGVFEGRCFPYALVAGECVWRASDSDRREAAHADFAREGIDDEVDVTTRGTVNDIAIDVAPVFPEVGGP